MQLLTEVAAFVLLYGTLVNAWCQQGVTMSTVRCVSQISLTEQCVADCFVTP